MSTDVTIGSAMWLDIRQRTAVADKLLTCLEHAAPGSEALLRGSLANGTADQYSDIDILWDVPDDLFDTCIHAIHNIVSRVQPVESLRSDPDLQNSAKRRLFFVRFRDIPLFWRVDLDVFAQSVKRDPAYDLDNSNARGSDCSPTESALANAVAAVKAHLRNDDDEAKALLVRAYQRVQIAHPDCEIKELILHLANSITAIDPAMTTLAGRVQRLAQVAL